MTLPTPTIAPVAAKSVLPRTQPMQVADGVVLRDAGPTGCTISFWLLFAVFWNGISWTAACAFLFSAITFIGAGLAIPEFGAAAIWGALFPLLLVGLFCGIGIWLALKAWHEIRVKNQFSQADLHLTRWPLHLGESATVTFRRSTTGEINVTQIEGKLRCYESATYSVGTSSRTVTEEVYSALLPSYTITPGVKQHLAAWQIQVPQQAPPSFSTSSNSLVWSLDVTLHSQNFPNVTSAFVLTVLPEVV